MAAITSVNASQAIVKLVATDALPALRNNLLLGAIVNRSFDNAVKTPGDVINIPIPGVMVANRLSEGGSVQTQNPTLGNAAVTLDRHIEASFAVPDLTQLLVAPNLLQLAMEPAIIALAEMVETDLFNLYTNFTVNAPVGTGGAGLASEAVLDLAEKRLFDAKALSQSATKYLIVGSSAYSDLRQLPRFTENQTNGNGGAIASGLVGQLKGFNIYRSQLVASLAGTTYNMAFVPNAMTLVTRKFNQVPGNLGVVSEEISDNGYSMRVVYSYNAQALSSQITIHMLYGVSVLRNAFGVLVLS